MAKKLSIDLVNIDTSRFKDTIKAYFLWKELDTIIRTSHTRGINIPETITETLLCFVSDFKLPKRLSNGRLHKAAGNSVSVPVIKRITEQIIQAL